MDGTRKCNQEGIIDVEKQTPHFLLYMQILALNSGVNYFTWDSNVIVNLAVHAQVIKSTDKS